MQIKGNDKATIKEKSNLFVNLSQQKKGPWMFFRIFARMEDNIK